MSHFIFFVSAVLVGTTSFASAQHASNLNFKCVKDKHSMLNTVTVIRQKTGQLKISDTNGDQPLQKIYASTHLEVSASEHDVVNLFDSLESKKIGKIFLGLSSKGLNNSSAYGEFTGINGTLSCQVPSGINLGTNLDKSYLKQVERVVQFKQSIPKGCSAEKDHYSFIRATKPSTTVILFHGYGGNPNDMDFLKEYFFKKGMNVIAPRVRGHFELNAKALDEVTARQWAQDSEEIFKRASELSPNIIVGGFSMGGLIASRLALKYPQKIRAVLLFSQAWRVSSSTSFYTTLGSIFGINADSLSGREAKVCTSYGSSLAGREVSKLAEMTEEEFQNFNLSNPRASVFKKIKAPIFSLNYGEDNVVDGHFNYEVIKERDNQRDYNLYGSLGGHISLISLSFNSNIEIGNKIRGGVLDHLNMFVKSIRL